MDQLVKHLTEIGLTTHEAMVYRYLLSQSPVNAADLSKHTGISVGRTYTVIDSLVGKGFCVVVPGKRKSFAPVKPSVAIERLCEERRQQEAQWQQLAEQAAQQLEVEFAASTDLSSEWDVVRVYTTAESMSTKFWQLCFAGRTTIRAINKPPYVMSRRSQRNRQNRDIDNLQSLLRSNVEVRTLIEEEVDESEDFLNLARICATGNQPVRVGRALPLKLHIFDDDAALITLSIRPASKQQVYSLLIEHRVFCTAMIELYESHWTKAVPLAEYLAKR
jgi:HTH-type transcriptional regulator, sugar sensing transcriptional regulator